MYPKEKVAELTGNLKRGAREWAERKIDELAAGHPRLRVASVYLKRGLANWMEREEARINGMADGLMLFIADKDGRIDADALMNDALAIFREMDVSYAEVAGFGIEYGKGAVTVSIPRGVLPDMIFGELGQIRITADDLMEMKELFAFS